ncbi:MAG: hypothetical protein AAF927_27535 [Bacteroidota bacterium]
MPPLPLYRFFQALRKANFALGVSDYSLLLEALNGGFGLQSEADLLRLCRTLWFKPGQSWELFQEQFYQALVEAKQLSLPEDDPATLEPIDQTKQAAKLADDAIEAVEEALDDQSTFESETANTATEEESALEAGKFVHLSIASSAELAGENLQSKEQIHTQLQAQSFIFQGRYQPISKRQLTQSWRYLPDRSEDRPTKEIDINATVENIAKTGRLENLAYQTQKEGIARLLLLIDYEGSMVAFHELAQQIAASAPKTEGKAPNVLYFHDVPGPQLFQDLDQTKAYQIQSLAPLYRHRKAGILIISDAGAARGRYDRQRIIQTEKALLQLRAIGQHIVWLNPVPNKRWAGTSAQYINKLLLPMYEVSESGMQQAINALRGKINRKP